jgi:hypothetical protein
MPEPAALQRFAELGINRLILGAGDRLRLLPLVARPAGRTPRANVGLRVTAVPRSSTESVPVLEGCAHILASAHGS